ncbi:MAG TPA: hypothetical protein PKK69_01070 [Ferruginibacter sp.]|nr:hypothetical protein [Ferruginibacter sp.]
MYKVIYFITLLAFLVAGCRQQNETPALQAAQYAGNVKNGLLQKGMLDSCPITCQYIPEPIDAKQAANRPYRFTIHINTGTREINDSTLYEMNYHATELFRLVQGSDTLKPVLCERMANGRTDMHLFTAVFVPSARLKPNQTLNILFLPGKLFPEMGLIQFASNDIIQASKTLYGYDEVKH